MREVKETVLPNGMRLKGDPSKLKKIGQRRPRDPEDDDYEVIAHLMSMMDDDD